MQINVFRVDLNKQNKWHSVELIIVPFLLLVHLSNPFVIGEGIFIAAFFTIFAAHRINI